MHRKEKFQFRTCLLTLLALVPAIGQESERIYSLAELSAIDRENEMWRLVDTSEEIEPNLDRLLAAGFPLAEVEELKPRLVSLWDIDPLEQFGWLDRESVARIKEVEREYTIRMREARLRKTIGLKRGAHAPETPEQVNARWRRAIVDLLDYSGIQEFLLMNSAAARALEKLTKDVSMTVAERRILCEWQQDFGLITRMPVFDRWQITARQEALMEYWRRVRDLLGDGRCAAYLQAADPGFGQMADVLNLVGGVNSSKILDLWWVRKQVELAEVQMIWGRAGYQLKVKAYESAISVLGVETLNVYEQSDDAKWLERRNPYQVGKETKVSQTVGD